MVLEDLARNVVQHCCHSLVVTDDRLTVGQRPVSLKRALPFGELKCKCSPCPTDHLFSGRPSSKKKKKTIPERRVVSMNRLFRRAGRTRAPLEILRNRPPIVADRCKGRHGPEWRADFVDCFTPSAGLLPQPSPSFLFPRSFPIGSASPRRYGR